MSPCVSPVLCHLLSHLPPTKGDQTGKWGGLGGSEGWGESGGHSGRSGGSGSDLGLVPTLAPPPPHVPHSVLWSPLLLHQQLLPGSSQGGGPEGILGLWVPPRHGPHPPKLFNHLLPG